MSNFFKHKLMEWPETEARKQASADELAEALRACLVDLDGVPFGSENKARAALAKYERVR